jgi:hypothetical protein
MNIFDYITVQFAKFGSMWTKEKEILAAQAAQQLDKIETAAEHDVAEAIASGAPPELAAAEQAAEQAAENAVPTAIKRARRKKSADTTVAS